jgi:hypothetical protein
MAYEIKSNHAPFALHEVEKYFYEVHWHIVRTIRMSQIKWICTGMEKLGSGVS